MRAILVGAGGVSRELLRRLGDMWEVTVVDTSSVLKAAKSTALLPCTAFSGMLVMRVAVVGCISMRA